MSQKEFTDSLNRTKKFALISFFILFVGSVGFDQVTKIHAERSLMTYSDQTNLKLYKGSKYSVLSLGEYIPEQGKKQLFASFGFNYVRNQGAAWGALSDIDDNIRIPFFYAITIIAVIVIGLYFRGTPLHHRSARLALILVLSGAAGNFLDRIRLGYVIDWIDVRWNFFGWRYNFPNFNFADSAITIGVFLLLLDSLVFEVIRNRREESKRKIETPDNQRIEV